MIYGFYGFYGFMVLLFLLLMTNIWTAKAYSYF